MSNMIMENIINFVNSDAAFNAFSSFVSMVTFFQEALEHYREKKWKKTFTEAILLSIALAVLCQIGSFFQAILIVSIMVLGITFWRRRKCSRNIRANIDDKQDAQTKDMLVDSMEGEYVPKLLDFSESAFKNAEQCLAERLPKAAIRYLNECKGKEKNQLRFVTRYADALIMLENYEGALAKLNALSAKQINKKKRFKSVMLRKATCYYSLNRYMEELDCYDKLIASNYKPEKYYYYRGKVKTRLLEKYTYVKEAEYVVSQKYGSKQGFIESALTDFERALSYGDKYKAKILSYMGSCYYHLQEKQKALDFFHESESLLENFENNHLYLGIYYYDAGDYDMARTYLQKGIADMEMDEEMDEVPYLYLARISYKEGIYDEAILHAAKALSIFPRMDECHGIQGDCYKDKNMHVEAISCYTRAIDIKHKADYFSSRAECYYNKKNPAFKKAHDDICEALKLNNSVRNQANEVLYRASLDKEMGQGKTLEEIERSIQPFSEKPEYYNAIGITFFKYGYWEEAEKYYIKTIEYDKYDSSAHHNLAIILRNSSRLEEAVEHLEVAIILDPTCIKSYELLEKCYRDLGSTGKEVETQIRIRILKKKYMTVNKENGDAVYRLGKYRSAEKYYRSALEYIPHDVAVLNNLACTLYYQERYDEAIDCLQRSAVQKRDYLTYYNLGNCYLRIGNMDKAKSNYQTAQKLSAESNLAKQMLQCLDPSEISMEINSEA
ncbi:MAG: tetratricopeptide repeat protein [Blautia sp.]|nr:tetratricopeptide repeat protein [Blautia sp.]